MTGKRWHLTRMRWRGFILVITTGFALPLWAGPVVIGNPSSAIKLLTKEEVRELYLGKTRTLPSVGTIELADQPADSATYREFYEKVTGKNPHQVRALWAKVDFIGKIKPPKVFDSDADIKEWVKKYPNAIGYIEKSSLDKSVNVLLVID